METNNGGGDTIPARAKHREHCHFPRECADLVLPWLSPRDLASASLACKSFYQSSSAITSRRAYDASGGLENHHVPFINTVDSHPYTYFVYSPSPLLRLPSSSSQPWGGELGREKVSAFPSFSSFGNVLGANSGCVCEEKCSPDCPCSRLRPDFFSSSGPDLEVMTECGVYCRCGPGCGNRSTQRGVLVELKIVKDERKGWGLHAAQDVQKGEFICEYAGEFLTTEEARRRQRIYDNLTDNTQFSPALLVVREHLPSGTACLRVNIDATMVGNVARFINHSCDGGNLLSILVRNTGSVLPHLCFFAARDIPEGEELTFSYGDIRLRPKGLTCFCGSSGCLGMLPSEET